MEMKILISFLIVFPACISSHIITLRESGGGIKRPGETMQLSCQTSGFPLASFGMNWISQAPGKGLKWMGGITSGGDIDFKPDLRNRLTIGRDILKSLTTLQMTNLQPEDTAVYYCARGGSWFDVWGQGTMVTVTSETPTAPTVFPLSPSCGDLSSTSQVTMGCLISGYFPQPVTVQWNAGAISTGITSFPPAVLSNGHATSISQLTVPAAKWAAEKFQCNVAHAPTRTNIRKDIPACKKNEPVPPEVCVPTDVKIYLLPPTPKDLFVNRDPKLHCNIVNLETQEGLEVTWGRQKKASPLTPGPLSVTEQSNGTFRALSIVRIPLEDWIGGETFTCSVKKEGFPAPITKSIFKKSAVTVSAPGVYLYPPHPEEAAERNPSLSLTCLVRGFNPDDISIQWLKNHNAMSEDDHVNTPVLKEAGDGSLFSYSKLDVPVSDWNAGNTFSCMVVHEALPLKFTQKSVKKSQGKK